MNHTSILAVQQQLLEVWNVYESGLLQNQVQYRVTSDYYAGPLKLLKNPIQALAHHPV